jgi:hypothetical protein
VDTDSKRQLLAGDSVHERLENAREARRPEPAHTACESIEQRICGGHGVERREVDGQSQQVIQRDQRARFGAFIDGGPGQCHHEPRRAWRPTLRD